MTFSAIDSALLGPLFATDAMRAVFSDRARIAAMLAPRRSWRGPKPAAGSSAGASPWRSRRSRPRPRPCDARPRDRGFRHPGHPIRQARWRRCSWSSSAGDFHFATTTQDIIDTASRATDGQGLRPHRRRPRCDPRRAHPARGAPSPDALRRPDVGDSTRAPVVRICGAPSGLARGISPRSRRPRPAPTMC